MASASFTLMLPVTSAAAQRAPSIVIKPSAARRTNAASAALTAPSPFRSPPAAVPASSANAGRGSIKSNKNIVNIRFIALFTNSHCTAT